MAILSPYNSFVEFGPVTADCKGNSTRVALPVYDNLGIKYQFYTDELLPIDTVFKAAVCSEDCETISNPDYEVVPLCNRWAFVDENGLPLSASRFPVTFVGGPNPGVTANNIDEFISIINDSYDIELPGIDYISCCEVPAPPFEIIFLVVPGEVGPLQFTFDGYYSSGYVDYPATDMDGLIDWGECFRYCILDDEDEVIACSNLFYRESVECKTTVFRYYNEENAYGFKYATYDDGGTTKISENTIRLKVNFSRPQFPVQENVYRQPNGFQQRINTVIEKEWLARTSYLDDVQHEKLVVLLKHDYVHVHNSEKGIDYRMTQIGDYEISYPEIDTNTSPAEFRINDYRNNNVNNNCGFECGIEFNESCDGEGGSVTVPCPEKFSVEFTGASGVMEPGNLIYQNDSLIGSQGVEVYREGLLQHNSGPNNVSFNSATGEVTFTPIVENNERIAIWEV